MAIEISCSECGRQFSISDAVAGSRVKCPGCGTMIAVPREASVAATRTGSEESDLPEPTPDELETIALAKQPVPPRPRTHSAAKSHRRGENPGTSHEAARRMLPFEPWVPQYRGLQAGAFWCKVLAAVNLVLAALVLLCGLIFCVLVGSDALFSGFVIFVVFFVSYCFALLLLAFVCWVLANAILAFRDVARNSWITALGREDEHVGEG